MVQDYIQRAIEYASRGTGIEDFSGFIILVDDFALLDVSDIYGIPVLIVPSRSMKYTFALAYLPGGCKAKRYAANLALEYQEINPLEGMEE